VYLASPSIVFASPNASAPHLPAFPILVVYLAAAVAKEVPPVAYAHTASDRIAPAVNDSPPKNLSDQKLLHSS